MNKELPIWNFRSEIVEAVENNPVVIITAETGAGKSTQVPQFLLEEGYNMVVTQPRRLAARTVAQRVAEEWSCELGDVIGFRTAYEKKDSAQTRCLFATDGLALVRELMGVGYHNVLVLDEVHEWNLNIEVLVAWTKHQIEVGVNFKVVLMSATLEAEKLSQFFGGAPIISVPGRLFPVEEKRPTQEIGNEIVSLLKNGRNVLVFQPGKSEIYSIISDLKSVEDLNVEILPLHGELTPEEQVACFRHYGRPKCVVSTNVAQTSVTIDDIDAVVDSGMERRIELVDEVEGLYLKPISLADREQRKGRAGRTKEGIYIDFCPSSDRLEFPRAEILRSLLDQTVLRLAEVGFDAEALKFFHQPDVKAIHSAKQSLKGLGCMDENGSVTQTGRRVAKLPISTKFARMIIEAERLGVVDDVITIAAILEQGGIIARKDKEGNDISGLFKEKICPDETGSDLMAQLEVYKAACAMEKNQMVESGVFVKAFFQSREKRDHLADALKGKVRSFASSGNRQDIIKAVCAGMVDHLYQDDYGGYRNGSDRTSRQINRDSVVSGGEWVVGLPFDLEINTRRGGRITLNLITMVTQVDPLWLAEIAPQLVKIEEGLNPFFDGDKDYCVSTSRTHFNDHKVKEEQVATPKHERAADCFANWLAGQMAI